MARALGVAVLAAAAVACARTDAAVVAHASDGGGAGVGAATATGANTCPLDLSRWGQLRGAEPERDGDVYRQEDNGIGNPSFWLPQQIVTGGQVWRFAFDTTVEAPSGGARVRIEVDWYATPGGDNSGYMVHHDGPWVDVPLGAAGTTRIAHTFTTPEGAVRANVLTTLQADDTGNTWTGRNCDYRRADLTPPPPPRATTTSRPAPATTTEPPPPPSPTTTPPSTAPPPPGDPSDEGTAADRHGWGAPIPAGSDEFDYGSEAAPEAPDPAKWDRAGTGAECWPGHAGNGRRCDANTRVVGGILRMVGDADGDTGWVASQFSQQYGRWEARVRSEATGPDSERRYHPLLILWPSSESWPEDGEYDYLENMEPGAQCVEAFIHYPHDAGVDVQQEFAQRCGVDQTQWHNIGVEWTPDHIKGFVDGEEWFSFSGGANDIRRCIQCSPGMHQTIQLDNFFGDAMQPAVYEVDWARVYPLDAAGAPAGG